MNDTEIITRFLLVFGISMARFTLFFTIIPFLGAGIISNTARIGVITSLALIVYPILEPLAPKDIDTFQFMGLFAKEAILGFLMAYAISVPFWIMEGVGFVTDNQRGVSQASIYDPLFGYTTSPLGSFLLQSAVVFFLSTGGFLLILGGVFESYIFWPVFDFYPKFTGTFYNYFIYLSASVLKYTAMIAAPMLVVFFIINLGLGLINRITPQLNVFFIAMPVNSAAAFIILYLYIYIMFDFFKDKQVIYRDIFKVLKGGI
ncbi:MAG: type III secretion system export apparatus subunit SctT [Nitrospirae bacterium]|nr:type III secretion system export apparatus subunit SctT [Nitrospirota bacterium]